MATTPPKTNQQDRSKLKNKFEVEKNDQSNDNSNDDRYRKQHVNNYIRSTIALVWTGRRIHIRLRFLHRLWTSFVSGFDDASRVREGRNDRR